MPATPQHTLTPTYLAADQDGERKWYVVIPSFTPDGKAMTGYGPQPSETGTFRAVFPDTARQKLQEKRDKGYHTAGRTALPVGAQSNLLQAAATMAGMARATFLPDGRIDLHATAKAPRRRRAQVDLWI